MLSNRCRRMECTAEVPVAMMVVGTWVLHSGMRHGVRFVAGRIAAVHSPSPVDPIQFSWPGGERVVPVGRTQNRRLAGEISHSTRRMIAFGVLGAKVRPKSPAQPSCWPESGFGPNPSL